MKNSFLKKTRNYIFYILIQLLRLVIFFIPWKFSRQAGAFLGFVIFILLPDERGKIYRNLDLVYGAGHYSARKKREFALKNLSNYAVGFFEFAKFTTWPLKKTASLVKETEGLEYLEGFLKEKKACVCVTAHYSNWELLLAYTASLGFKTGAIGKKIFDENLDRVISSTRRKSGTRLFDKDHISKEMIKGLRQDMFLGMLVDQDTRVESIESVFLGLPAKTPSAPAVLAKKFRVNIGTFFLIRRKDGYYKLKVNKPYIPAENDTVEAIVRRYNDEISAVIMEEPLQWAWIHERFKSTIK
jgi:KDO2-lipid IV(A) lauroyltransferase